MDNPIFLNEMELELNVIFEQKLPLSPLFVTESVSGFISSIRNEMSSSLHPIETVDCNITNKASHINIHTTLCYMFWNVKITEG